MKADKLWEQGYVLRQLDMVKSDMWIVIQSDITLINRIYIISKLYADTHTHTHTHTHMPYTHTHTFIHLHTLIDTGSTITLPKQNS